MNNVVTIIGKRIGLGVLTMFMVSIIIFLAVNMLPGDFAQALLGQSATPEAVAAMLPFEESACLPDAMIGQLTAAPVSCTCD